jgi:hypothetical protein
MRQKGGLLHPIHYNQTKNALRLLMGNPANTGFHPQVPLLVTRIVSITLSRPIPPGPVPFIGRLSGGI